MISVLTPTIRNEGLEVIKKALNRQTFEDYEWIVCSPEKPNIGYEYEWLQDDFKGGIWTLNRVYNKMIKFSGGDLIVSIQDFTSFDPDTLERLYTHYKLNNNAVVSGVGNKYLEISPLGAPIWYDPRITGQSFRQTSFNNIEFNFCSIPKHLLKKVGGFDEDMDFKFYGMDAYDVLRRLSNTGHTDFYIDENIKSYSLTHGRVKDWEEKNGIHGEYEDHVRGRNKDVLSFIA